MSNNDVFETILGLLKNNLVIVFSWGAQGFTGIVDDNGYFGIQFKVNGFKFKGIVQIVYHEGSDLFIIRYMNESKTIMEEINGIYWDDVVNTIDERIEKTEHYSRDVKLWLKKLN